MLDSLRQDLRYALRSIGRSPMFSLTAMLSLAVGIGANTAIFTIVNALLLRPVSGVVEPNRLVDIGRTQRGQGFDNNSYPNFRDVQRRATTLEGVFAQVFAPRPMSLGRDGGSESVHGSLVSANYFKVLGTRPIVGRLFDGHEDDAPGANPVAVLSHRLWTGRFNADTSVAGRTIHINGHPFTVVGVTPEGFHGTTMMAPDLWVPASAAGLALPRLGDSLLTSREAVWLILGGRLKPGVSVAQSRAELDSIGQALEREFPRENEGRGLRLVPTSVVPGNMQPVSAFLGLLMAVVGMVLAIACVNLAGVLLARASARRREIAVRLAIGAGRSHLVRLLLSETVMLFAGGAVAGLLLARGMTSLLVGLLPSLPIPLDVTLPTDWRVATFTLVLTLAASLFCGLAPAFEAARTDVVSSLKTDNQGSTGRLRLRSVFLTAQVALSMILVVGALLFLRALGRAGSIDPGFDLRNVELTSLDFSLAGYTNENGPLFARQLLERVRAVPGVQSASLAAQIPLGGGGMGFGGLRVPGVEIPPEQRRSIDWNVIEPGYFATLKSSLLSGRDFTDADRRESQPAIILNETAARYYFPGQDPVGRVLEHRTSPTETRRLTVVGVARDTKYRFLGEAPRLFVYVPLQQLYEARMTIVTRVRPGVPVQAELRRVIASLNPSLPIVSAQTFEDYAALGLVPQRIAASVSGSLGLVGLLLAAIGIYGVTAYSVAQRTREIGIRMALGAQRASVVGMVLRQGLGLTVIGLVIGMTAAAVLSRLLGSLLFGVPPGDPLAFGGAVGLFLGVGLLACLVPARRASRVHPMEALRYE